jgi:MinD-like ATPase involved in chromosome partitioning or flagellar assembly
VRVGIPSPTVWDFAVTDNAKPEDLDDYLVAHSSGLRVLLGPPKPVPAASTAIDPVMVAEIIHQLEQDGFHFIVIDVNSELNAVTTAVLQSVHDIYVVLTPTASGVQDAYRTTEALRRMGLRHKLHYVVNRCRGAAHLETTMGDLGCRVIAEIPDDAKVQDAENQHRPVVQTGGAAATAIRRLAGSIFPGLRAPQKRRRSGKIWRRQAV